MEHIHSIIIIKKEDKYLNYYDERWQMYLFPNIKGNDIEEIKKLYNTNNVRFLFDKVHDKYSVSHNEVRTYHHYFFQVETNVSGEYFTLEELLKNPRVKKYNEDIINYVKEYYNDNLILEKNLPSYLENDLKNLKEGIKNNVSYLDCLINELQGSVNSAFVDGDISEEQCDYLYEKYIRMVI